MADTKKTFNARWQIKTDTYAEWHRVNPVLLENEPIAVIVPAETGAVVQEPAYLLKLGDGVNAFDDLPYFAAIAADVYDWAKAENKPNYDAKEITGIDTYIAEYVNEQMGISVDTDTQYTLVPVDGNAYQFKLMSKSKGAEEFTTEVATITIPQYDDSALANRVAALEGLVGTTGVGAQIQAAIAALDLANTYEAKGEAAKVQTALDEYVATNDAAVKANADAVAEEVSRATEAEEANAAAAKAADDKAVAAQDAVDELAGKVGDVPADKTVVQMISDAQTAATYDDTQVKADIKANSDAIDVLNGGAEDAGSVAYQIAQAVAAIINNPDETMNSIQELVDWVNGHADDALALSNQVTANKDDIAALAELVGGTAVATQITEAIAAALKIEGVDKYALATDLTAAIGRIAALEKDAHTHANKEELDKIASGDKAKWDEASGKAHEHENKTILDAISVEDINNWNGKANDADLAAIAKSGNVNDLIQDDGDYIIFNAGSATTVM